MTKLPLKSPCSLGIAVIGAGFLCPFSHLAATSLWLADLEEEKTTNLGHPNGTEPKRGTPNAPIPPQYGTFANSPLCGLNQIQQ